MDNRTIKTVKIEYALRYTPSRRGRFRGVWDAQGNYADLGW